MTGILHLGLFVLGLNVSYGLPRPKAKVTLHHVILSSKENLCVYENLTYVGGQKFKPDPCTFCHCPKRGGEARCAIQDCFRDPSCVRFDTDSEECCQRCLEYGCQHTDGKVYPLGQEISGGKCERCFCPKQGGHSRCVRQGCPPVLCVNPIHRIGECCPICPTGENCWLDGKVIAGGKRVPHDKCKQCECPPEHGPHWTHGIHRQAICTMDKCD